MSQRDRLESSAASRRFRPYPAYKDSGVESLGEIPAHWMCLALSRATASRCDGPFGSGLKSEHYSGSGVRVIRLQNLGWAEFLDSDRAYVEQSYARDLGDHSVIGGDLLIAGLGDEKHPVGRACVAPEGIEPAMVKADCFRFRLRRERLLPCFAAYQLSVTAAAAAGSLSTGATRSRINLGTTSSRKLALPRVEEQRAIAVFLNQETARIDALVAKKERLIGLLQEKRTALITRAVTKGLDPKVPMKDSGVEWLGEIPAHWKVKRVGQLLTERPRNGVSPAIGPEGTTPTFSTAAVSDGVVAINGNVKYTTISSKEAKPFLVLQGDVLLLRGSGSRSLVGRAGIVTGLPPEGCIYPDILIRVRSGAALTPWFLVKCLNSAAVRPQVESAAKTAAGIWKITGEDVRCIVIPVPPYAEQRRLETEVSPILEKVDATAARIRGAIDCLKEFRTALISAAVTGKIDVRGEVALSQATGG